MSSNMVRVLLIAIVAAAALCGRSGVPSAAATPPTRAAAEADAPRLLSRLVLPAGSTRLSSEPAGDHAQLARSSHPATPNLVDVHGWWRVPESVDQTVLFIESHRPSGTTVLSRGVADGRDYTARTVMFAFRPLAGVLAARSLAVAATTLPNGSTGVRADGEAVWLTPRPSWAHVPPSKLLRVSVIRGRNRLQGPISVRSRSRIDRVVSLLNGLPAAQPGASSCPIDQGIRVVTDFYASKRARAPSAVATIVAGGCGGALLKLRGHRALALGNPPVPSGDRSVPLQDRVAEIIGEKLRTA